MTLRHGIPWGRGLLLLAVAVSVTGCNEDMSDLRSYVERINSRPGGEIPPLPEMATFESYAYPEEHGRNPFAVLSFAEPPQESEGPADSGPKPDPTRQQEPLEEFTLDSLTYVGTLQRNGRLWGLVRAPGGTVHRVRTGNYMGQNYGEILAIKPNEIRVRELVQPQQGRWTEREASLALND